MKLYKVTFQKRLDITYDDFDHKVHGYLACLLHNGQAYGECQYGWQDDKLVVVISLPSISAVAPRYNSEWGKKALKDLRSVLNHKPDWEEIAADLEDRASSNHKTSTFLYLYTTAFTIDSPLCNGSNDTTLPTYRLPLPEDLRDDIFWWSHRYSRIDSIWIDSGALEMNAYRQLSRIDSEITKSGREICQKIEAAVQKPTYYYMMRYVGLKKGEHQGPCPGCGKNWQAFSDNYPQPFWEFHFKCDPCRLVSHVAVSNTIP